MRRFNVTGVCIPHKHYMVDISGKIEQIKKLVDYGDYFTINRARQYGKTTTLACLKKVLEKEYVAALMSFENLGEENFTSAETFCGTFAGLIRKAIDTSYVSEAEKEYRVDEFAASFQRLSNYITEICKGAENAPSGRKIVLMIDEVDKSTNNRVYLNFLSMLRSKFLAQQMETDHTFHSVILAGVYDIKNLKLKMINEGTYSPVETEGRLRNSPWNIAVNFNVDMSFNPVEIATMLNEYEADHNTGMDITAISEEIYSYTSGYPFLVSRICQCIDEELDKDWSLRGVHETVKIILQEKNTLFEDIFKNIENNEELHDFLYELLVVGLHKSFNRYNPIIDIGITYCFLKRGENNRTVVSNRMFEILMCDYFISKDETAQNKKATSIICQDVVHNGKFDMELCLTKFAQHYAEIYNDRDADFIERKGRLLFLTYLKPLINGQGFYHIESQFTDLRRMDIVVDWGNQQFIIELKLWKGEKTHEEAYEQLAGYLDGKNADTGYLLTFDFRKDKHLVSEGMNKQPLAEWVEYGGKRIFDVVV